MARKMRDSGVEWIGEVPEGWEFLQLKRLAKFKGGVGFPPEMQGRKGESIRFIKVNSLASHIDPNREYDTISQSDADSLQAKVFPKGTIVFAKVGAALLLHRFERLPFDSCIDNNMMGIFDVVANPDWLCYALSLLDFNSLVNPGAVPSVNQSQVGSMRIPTPPLPEQRAIADYLDEKCGAIDVAIAEAKKGIEEYKAWKISLIDDIVCNGIDRHRHRKETGEVWLADIPIEWDFIQIRYLFALRDERNNKPLKDVNLISLYTDKGVVQHSDLEKTTGNKASTADGYKLVYKNDIVVNIILCWMGAVGRSAYNGVTSPAYDVYRPIDSAKVLSRYYHYLFRTPRFNGKCYEEGRGIMMMRWRTYSSEFRAIKVPVPPFEEQQAIADYLDEKCAAIDKMVAEKNALIADLEAYKKSLIYETVTGKREVK